MSFLNIYAKKFFFKVIHWLATTKAIMSLNIFLEFTMGEVLEAISTMPEEFLEEYDHVSFRSIISITFSENQNFLKL